MLYLSLLDGRFQRKIAISIVETFSKTAVVLMFSVVMLFSILDLHVSAKGVLPEPFIGVASVVDGDTIEISGVRIRFYGIDAPESRQICLRDEVEIKCGKEAAFALSDFLGDRAVFCKPLKFDRYNRVVARCEVDHNDVAAWMVRSGYAVAYLDYSQEYIADEEFAKAAKKGIWGTQFKMPWDWRRSR